ncbi:uncharacterized protein FOMMEDRAFT_162156 [Fomitiporia mediterranea MF3/22]|uniref:uncharacterized protein n=1 Tax=Fomitiporia mediterranea (strain MF3/22) TaxID=694068 RepID=UPI0004407C1F|nr:uncharacterized protein FOMMEDRAFT_162156 [Fomitiporia mediterranea MF3/22]EJC97821.1 hypothetical protein FOMMEDRAFT_162156 [Fomitiporia mediterranea MF3/22]
MSGTLTCRSSSCSLKFRFNTGSENKKALWHSKLALIQCCNCQQTAHYLRERYHRQWRMEDLEEAIVLCRAALSLCPEGHPNRSYALGDLASSLTIRYQRSGRPEDLEESIELHRAALNLHSDNHLDLSYSLSNLARSLNSRYQRSGRLEDLEESIEQRRAALTLQPKGHPDRTRSLGNLAISLHTRYQRSGRSLDLEEAIELHRAALALRPEGHWIRSHSLDNLATSLRTRYEQSGQSEDLEEAIELHRAALSLRPEGHPDRSNSLGNLAGSLDTRYQRSGQSEDLEETIELHHAALTLQPKGHPDRSNSLNNLASSLHTKYHRSGRLEDLEESIDLHRAVLTLRPEGHPYRSRSLDNLAISLRTRYQRSGQLEDIEESIELRRAALTLQPEGHPDRTSSLNILANALFSQFEQLQHAHDFEECVRLLEQSTGHLFSSSLDRLKAARRWTVFARIYRHNTTLRAYHEVMSLLQRALTISPTLYAQHDFLVRNREYGALAVEAASHAIEEGELDQAVELLEQGRALLWAQMRGFRTPLDRLVEMNKELADRFQNVSRQLEDLATSSEKQVFKSSPALVHDIRDKTELLDEMLRRRRTLIEELDKLTDKIRCVPGFENFLKTARFETLRLAASEGPVIMINHSEYRCDALIITPTGTGPPLVCVPLDNDFYEESCKLCQGLVETRIRNKPGSNEYDKKLRESMKMLWDKVVSKVIDRFKELGIARGSRIWWCPTSVLSVLPFHAAGPYHGSDGTMKYLCDDYISSYTPTLGALINAQSYNPGRDPEILIVADTKSLDSTKMEVITIRNQTRIYGTKPKVLLNNRASHEAVIKTLRKATWVHLPATDTWTRSPNLPNAEFAFLSACHTAEQPHLGTYDEVLHLAAAMQFCGFRSVIGTMWELYDPDGPPLARGVYKYLAESEENEGRYKRAAAGLRGAVVALKAKEGIRTERWVNMIHIGA